MASLHGPAGLAHDEATAGESVWRAPLLGPALAVTAGIVLDRHTALPLVLVGLAGTACLAAFLVLRFTRHERLALVYLHLLLAAVGAAAHQCFCDLHGDDDIALLAGRVARPVRLLGVVVEEPKRLPAPGEQSPLRSQPRPATAGTLLRATHLAEGPGQRAVSGQVRLLVSGKPGQKAGELLAGVHPGDEIEVVGKLVRISGPGNPNEFDLSRYWADQGVGVQLRVSPGGASVRRIREGWQGSPRAWLAVLRGQAHAVFERELGDDSTQGLARALLLGEGAPMSSDDWAPFVRTGVVHVLAISGQHLVVVALFLWWLLRLLGVRQRRGAILVAFILLGYALLTGGRPPAMRAAVAACAVCAALVLRRPVLHVNLFALAWLVVIGLDPGSAFDTGCQLSFLAVAILAHVAAPLFAPRPEDPVDQLEDEARPGWLRFLRRRGCEVWQSYAVCAIVWVAITPLVAYRTGLVAPAALLLGPPLTLLTSIALLLGFATLGLAALGLPAFLASKPMAWCLWGCEGLVKLAEAWPMHFYVGEVPLWWVVVFYIGLFAVCTRPTIRWRWLTSGAAGWVCVLLLAGAAPPREAALRCTFLDVGHGGCTVLEVPDGQVFLYDTGAMRGPDVAERTIAPFLWGRGLHRLDAVILSHADLDHFNGLLGVVERFRVGRVLLADSFETKNNRAVAYTLKELRRRGVALEYVAAGDRLTGGGTALEVLHPPPGWQGQTANENSVVVQVRHAGSLLLLTGDLEGAGLASLLCQPSRQVDVLQAPHHGSRRIDVEGLMRWARPRLVVSCQGPPGLRAPPYARPETAYWTTWEHGAIVVCGGGSGLTVRGHRHGEMDLLARSP
jgi:competence protein ComEC